MPIVSGSYQVGGVRKVVSRFNTKNPFSLDSVLKANQFDTNARLSVGVVIIRLVLNMLTCQN
ncbi:hypothetical protein VN1027_10600 [Helicobacter pylori]|nr:hypothetical protein VN1027_10600 [Helicobacter pylori]